MDMPSLGKKTGGFDDLDADIDGGDLGMDSNFGKMGKKKGQLRGADGKFESMGGMNDDFDMNNFTSSGPYRNEQMPKKKSKASKIMSLTGSKNDPFEAPKKKGRGRPSGTGASQVANAFYEPQAPQASQDIDVIGPSSMGSDNLHTGKYLGGMDGGLDSDQLSRQESEQEICGVCMKYSYIPSGGHGVDEDPNVLWIGCSNEMCGKWYHAPCKGIDAATFDPEKDWYCCQPNTD